MGARMGVVLALKDASLYPSVVGYSFLSPAHDISGTRCEKASHILESVIDGVLGAEEAVGHRRQGLFQVLYL